MLLLWRDRSLAVIMLAGARGGGGLFVWWVVSDIRFGLLHRKDIGYYIPEAAPVITATPG
jgi:hypothetical protein